MPVRYGSVSEELREALSKVAPGTPLRAGIERIVRAKGGALVVVNDDPEVLAICSGGFLVDAPFSPQRLSELAKMDGAIILSSGCDRIARANVHLVPDPTVPTSETGTRHRTAERVARSLKVPVVSASEEMGVINLYAGGSKHQLQDVSRLLDRANQALQTLERYKVRLEDAMLSLTSAELEDAVSLRDVAAVLQRGEMVNRIAEEIETMIVELGVEARLLRLQLDEIYGDVEDELDLVVTDYIPEDRTATITLAEMSALSDDDVLDLRTAAAALHRDGGSQGPRPGGRATGPAPAQPGAPAVRRLGVADRRALRRAVSSAARHRARDDGGRRRRRHHRRIDQRDVAARHRDDDPGPILLTCRSETGGFRTSSTNPAFGRAEELKLVDRRSRPTSGGGLRRSLCPPHPPPEPTPAWCTQLSSGFGRVGCGVLSGRGRRARLGRFRGAARGSAARGRRCPTGPPSRPRRSRHAARSASPDPAPSRRAGLTTRGRRHGASPVVSSTSPGRRTASSTDMDSAGLAPDSVSCAPNGVPPVVVSRACVAEGVPGAAGQRQRPSHRHGHLVVGGRALEGNGSERRSQAVEEVGGFLHGGERMAQRHRQPTVLRRRRTGDLPPGRRGIVEDEAPGQAGDAVDDVLVDRAGDDDLTGPVGVDGRVDGNVETAGGEEHRAEQQDDEATEGAGHSWRR